MKTCTKCGEEKPESEYTKDWSRKSGLHSRCRTCTNAAARAYRASPSGKEKVAASQARYHQNNKHTNNQYRETIKRNYEKWRENSPRFNLYMALRHAVKRRPTDNPITIDHLMDLWKQQEGKCAVSGLKMTWGKGDLMPTSVSLDRIDQKVGYAIGNVRLVCYQVNTFRGRWSDEQMFSMALSILANMKKPKLRLVS